jgi:hypothetical protein
VESLPNKKKDPQKKEEKEKNEQGLKSKKVVKPHMKKLHVLKEKKEDEIYKLLEEILSKERKKRDHIFQCKIRCVASSIPTHQLHLHYLLFLDFSLSYLVSLHHSPSTLIICHTNSLEWCSIGTS